MAKKEKNVDPIREAKAVYSAPTYYAARNRVSAPRRPRGAYRNAELADSIRFGYTISVNGANWPGASHVKGRSKRGWENGGKSFRKVQAAKLAQETKAARDAAEAERRKLNRERHAEWLLMGARRIEDPAQQLDWLAQHTNPAMATAIMEKLAA